MAYYQGNDLRKPSGGRKRPHRKKRKYELGRPPTLTKLGSREERKIIRVRGGNYKVRLRRAVYINLVIPEEKRVQKVRVLAVIENPANPDYSRSGVITRGALVRTELGVARVTSRPGQDGVLNGILIKRE